MLPPVLLVPVVSIMPEQHVHDLLPNRHYKSAVCETQLKEPSVSLWYTIACLEIEGEPDEQSVIYSFDLLLPA